MAYNTYISKLRIKKDSDKLICNKTASKTNFNKGTNISLYDYVNKQITIRDNNKNFIEKVKKYIESIANEKYSSDIILFDDMNYIFDSYIRQSVSKGYIINDGYIEFKVTPSEIVLPSSGIYLRDYPELQFIINKIICLNNSNRYVNLIYSIMNKDYVNLREFRGMCELSLDLQNLIDGKLDKISDLSKVEELLLKLNEGLDYDIDIDYGKLIVFEGCDTVGKDYILNNLKLNKDKFYFTREPGGPEISEEIRSILLSNKYKNTMSYRTEVLLYAASRIQHVDEVIIPKLQSGINVITNRFYHSSVIYQTKRNTVNVDDVVNITKFAIRNHISPNLTFSLYINEEILNTRLNNKKNKDRLEQESNEFFIQINNEYKNLELNKAISDIDIYNKEEIIIIHYNENKIDDILKFIHNKIYKLCGDDDVLAYK